MSAINRTILDEAKAAGLLGGEKTAHVSVRTTSALLAAAKERTGIESTTELIEVALAAIALPDPVAAFLKKTRGKLGRDHKLEY